MAFLLWFAGSFFVGLLGRGRAIGFAGFFLMALLLSPVTALIVLVLTQPAPVQPSP